MKISYSYNEIEKPVYGDHFLDLKKHFLKIDKISQKGQIIEFKLVNSHRSINLELTDDDSILSQFIINCNSLIKDFKIDSIIGKTIFLETERLDGSIKLLSLELYNNYFHDDFDDEYNEIKSFSARNIEYFSLGVSKNVGISPDIIALLHSIPEKNWDDIYFVNKCLSKDLLNQVEDRSQRSDFYLAINESDIGDENLLDILLTHYEACNYSSNSRIDSFESDLAFHKFSKLKRLITENSSIIKNEEYLFEFPHLFDWDAISKSSSVKWDSKFILKFIDKLNRDILSLNPYLPWDEKLIKDFEGYWNWVNLSKNLGIVWNNKMISSFKSRIDWDFYSCNPYLPWSTDIIEKYKSKLDWKELSANRGLSWSINLLDKYLNLWDWDVLSGNESIFWDEVLLSKFKNKINWKILSNNHGGFWTFKIIIKFSSKLDFITLSQNTSLPWSFELLKGIRDPNLIKKWRGELFDIGELDEIDNPQKKSVSALDDEYDYQELNDSLERERDYYQNTSLDVILGLRSKTTDEIIQDCQREEYQEAMEDLAYEYEDSEKAVDNLLTDNPLLNKTIWGKIFGGIFSEAFLYDVLIDYEKHNYYRNKLDFDLEA